VSLDLPDRIGEDEVAASAALAQRIAGNVQRGVQVRGELLGQALVALVAEGHLLIEDLPGVGKTTLARALARSIDLQFARVQCTADLLPADVVGTNVFNQREDRFEFRPGPIFANVVIVDEINRASPKTQSGLLECMQERRVTVDVHTHELARPFLVLATQNPVEYEGTYPLPEAQVDRFMMRLSLGYPDSRAEADMLKHHETGDRVAERGRPTASTPPTRCAATSSPCCSAPATTRASSSGPRRGPGSCCCAPPRRARCSRGATTRCPTTSRRSPRPCSRTGSCSRRRPPSRRPRRSSPMPSTPPRPCRSGRSMGGEH
jgi:hypothetical protein